MSSAENESSQTLLIAIPVADDRLAMHFGHCEQFALFDVRPQTKEILDHRRLTPPGHQPGMLPVWLRDQGTNLVIAGGMGTRARDIFAEHGIEVIVGAAAEEPEAIVRSYLAGELRPGDNICDH